MDDKNEGYPDDNPKSRIGIKKVQLHLVPPAATIHEALAMADGAAKYGPYNWRENKVAASVYISAAQRHLAAYLDGERVAGDSGVHHLGHARACLGIILDAEETGNLVDDRPCPGAAAEMLARYVETGEAPQELRNAMANTILETLSPTNAAEEDFVKSCSNCRDSASHNLSGRCYSCVSHHNWLPKIE